MAKDAVKKEPNPKWTKVNEILKRFKPVAWEPLSADIKEIYGFKGYTKARNYFFYYLKNYSIEELEQITETDMKEFLMQALLGQKPDYKPKKNEKGKK